MPRDRKGEVSLPRASTLDSHFHQRAGIENRRERGYPGLIVVLGAKEGEHRIGEVAFHQLGGPELPCFEQFMERLLAVLVCMAAKKLARGWRATCAAVEKRDVHFALGKGAIDEGQVPNDRGQESQAEARFGNDEKARETRTRHHIADPQSEESCSAQVSVGPESRRDSGDVYRGTRAVLHQSEAQHESDGPYADEDQ